MLEGMDLFGLRGGSWLRLLRPAPGDDKVNIIFVLSGLIAFRM